MTQFAKHFSVDQANLLLPWVRSVFVKAAKILKEVRSEQSLGEQVKHWPRSTTHGHGAGRVNGKANGHAHAAAAVEPGGFKLIAMEHLWTGLTTQEKIELINGLLGAVQEEGIVIQDVERGLIDFPAIREGEEILLCYELSDGERIGYWHDLQAGYSGRQPLDDQIAG